jgi:hypothetical protein
MFYEQAYSDLAQVLASCQTLNCSFTTPAAAGVMAFKVKYYGAIPFTIQELYTPNDPLVLG